MHKKKYIFEKWKKFLSESVVNSREELIDIITRSPNQEIFVDTPSGNTKKFGGLAKTVLPFDYGEYPKLINPADNMGWDVIIVPSSSERNTNLLPVGHVQYYDDEDIWEKVGKKQPDNISANTKIILANDGNYYIEDKNVIEDFFKQLIQFKPVVWYVDRDKG
tara:strand:- start:1026 stop:1514 length:489 start_codon:yes stop_codon:yes gene_type:complete